VKDLVPDLTQFYKQYKSIKPYLQRDTPPPDVSPSRFPSVQMLTATRAKKTDSLPPSGRNSMASTNAFSALVARHLAPLTGGTVINTSDLLFFFSPTGGWRIHEMNARLSERKLLTTV
jgi:hypothetical protein